jgi:hypothetical protein
VQTSCPDEIDDTESGILSAEVTVLSDDFTLEEFSMIKRFNFLALAAVLAFALTTTSQAATVVVTDAGGGSADVAGTATGATITTDSYTNTNITSVNLLSVNLPLSMTITLTGSGTNITGSGSKTIDGTTLDFTVTDGFAIGSHLNLDGTITSISGSSPGYDFSGMVGADVSISLDKTGVNFGNIVGHAGTAVTAAGLGVEEASVVPEPTSIALLGIGMTGFLTFRRLFKRLSVA